MRDSDMAVHPQPSESGDRTPGWQPSSAGDEPSVPHAMVSGRTSGARPRPRPTGEGNRLGRFWILDTLGSGGMGVVLEAYDDTLDRTVALKLLHPWGSEQHRARLLREAKALARLSHPNVVQVYEIGTVDDNTFIAMELVRGQNLRDWGRQPHSWRTTVDVYVQAGQGLAAAHAEGLVHRDFKPDNCIIGDNGRVRVLDFGLARELEFTASGEVHELEHSERLGDGSEPLGRSAAEITLRDPLTVTGTLLGTVAYMSYEQLRGRPVDALSDQFSFCASLWEALYGVRAFAGQSPYALVASLKLNRLNPIPADARVPRRVRQVLVRGLALDPAQRWPSMDVLLERLRALTSPHRWWRAAAILALGIGLGGGALALLGVESSACDAPEAGLEGAWGPPDRAAVEKAFDRHMPSDTSPVLRSRVVAELDDYVKEWTDMAESACRATFVNHQQSELLFDRRMRCLARGRNRLRSSIDALVMAQSGPELVQRAILPFRLPDLAPCADLESLASELPLPSEPVQRERAAELRRQIDEAHTLREAGMSAEGIALAMAVRDQATTLGDPLLLAEALECLGRLQAESTHTREAVETLAEAVIEAERISADELAARAWLSLLYAMTMEHDLQAAKARVLAARAAVERTGNDALRAWWLNNVGILYGESRQFDKADDLLERALELKSRTFGAGHLEVGITWFNLGTLRMNTSDLEGAAEAFEHAHAIFEATVTAAHPLSVFVESGRCRVDVGLGRYASAIERCGRVLEHFETSPGAAVAEYRVRVVMAEAQWGAGRYEQARRTAQWAGHLGRSIGPAEVDEMRQWLAAHELP